MISCIFLLTEVRQGRSHLEHNYTKMKIKVNNKIVDNYNGDLRINQF